MPFLSTENVYVLNSYNFVLPIAGDQNLLIWYLHKIRMSNKLL